MKRTLIFLLCVCLLPLCAGCGSSSAGESAATEDAEESVAAEDAAAEDAADAASSAVSDVQLSSEDTVVESQDCYDSAGCFVPEEDGTYHFCARTADAFQGSEVGHDGDTITWTIYVLDEAADGDPDALAESAWPAAIDLNGTTDLPLKAGQYVYCVCSLREGTGSPAADGAGALVISATDLSYLPCAENNYQRAVSLGAQCVVDLDGDGAEEQIYYSISPNTVAGTWSMSLLIDGTEYFVPENDYATADYGVWFEDPDVEDYYITDLDEEDGHYELALVDSGSNGVVLTHFFRYDGGELVWLGFVSGDPDDHTTVFGGDGTVSSLDYLNVMQSWSGLRTFVLEEDGIVERTGEFCTPVLPDGWSVTLLLDLTVYAAPDLSAEQSVLSASSSALSFPSTDGEHWVQILCADGSTGWAYFSDFSTVLSGGESLEASDVFGNLYLVG